MLRFLTLVLFSFHLVKGDIFSYEGYDLETDNDVTRRRFTYEDGEYEIATFMRIDWYSARNLCKMQGGQLLSIETHGENIAVLQALSDFMEESFWTSGSDIDKAELFYWDTTGALIDNFTFWGPSQPVKNNTEHCVELNSDMNHMWADAECDLDRFFVCEFHPCRSESNDDRSLLEATFESTIKEDPLLIFLYGNGTYVIPNNTATWVDSKNMCKMRGMELVSIETFDENLAILDALLPLEGLDFWTSGSNLGHLDNFYWEGTGHAVGPYTGWSPGQPNNATNFNCVLLQDAYSHMWDDFHCSYVYNYICEWHPCQSSNVDYE